MCLLVVPQLFTKQPESVGLSSLLNQPGRVRTRSHVRLTGYPNPSHTVETDSRARPAFELDVDSPGATRSCVLLVRGTTRFRSFRRSLSQEETGPTCKTYD